MPNQQGAPASMSKMGAVCFSSSKHSFLASIVFLLERLAEGVLLQARQSGFTRNNKWTETIQRSMKSLNLLLGSSDRRVSNLIEVMIRDVCYNRAVVNFVRMMRIDQFIYQARQQDFDLIIVAPDSLLPAPRQAISPRLVAEGIRQIRTVRVQSTPIIAIAVPAENEAALTEA